MVPPQGAAPWLSVLKTVVLLLNYGGMLVTHTGFGPVNDSLRGYWVKPLLQCAWLGRLGSNQCMPASETGDLPLVDSPITWSSCVDSNHDFTLIRGALWPLSYRRMLYRMFIFSVHYNIQSYFVIFQFLDNKHN